MGIAERILGKVLPWKKSMEASFGVAVKRCQGFWRMVGGIFRCTPGLPVACCPQAAHGGALSSDSALLGCESCSCGERCGKPVPAVHALVVGFRALWDFFGRPDASAGSA